MNRVFICAILLAMSSCKTTKSNSTHEAVTFEKQLRVVGTVVLGNDPCPILIRAYHSGTEFMIVPLNLEEKFRVDGMKLRFDFIEAENPKTNKCSKGKTVTLEEVTRLRQ